MINFHLLLTLCNFSLFLKEKIKERKPVYGRSYCVQNHFSGICITSSMTYFEVLNELHSHGALKEASRKRGDMVRG